MAPEESGIVCFPNSNTPVVVRQIESALISEDEHHQLVIWKHVIREGGLAIYFYHRHRGNGQPTSNLTTLIDVYALPSARIGDKRDNLLPL